MPDFHRHYAMMLALCAVTCVTGCSFMPRSHDDGTEILAHEKFSPLEQQEHLSQEERALSAKYGWWQVYKNDNLNGIVSAAFIENPTIAQVEARLRQAQANVKKSSSSLFPTLDVQGTRETQNGDNAGDSDFTLRGAAAFEIDLWGKNRADINSATLLAQAANEDVHAAIITLSGQIVENWLTLLGMREQISLLEKQISINGDVLALLEKRHAMGNASALDILQQKELLAQSQSLLPDLQAAQEIAGNQILYLSGKPATQDLEIPDGGLPEILPLPDTGLPSFLLANRPDIVAGWNRLKAAQWASHSASLDRLPQFTLNAGYTTNATLLSGLFDQWLLTLAANVAAPIIDGGNRRAEAVRAKAAADERFHAYRDIVLQAVREVEDALTRNAYQDRKINAIETQLNIARATLEQAQISYANGGADYLNVLQAINNVQALERNHVQARLDLALERVTLYRALGGRGWARKITQQQTSTTVKG